ncbi:MAG: chromate efflux transporter [Pseudohongiellaceae bacterium]
MHEETTARNRRSPWLLFLVFLRLGLTSFGGPIAHLGYFREEFVSRRKWLDDAAYADLVALCQFLPGPTSSQVGIAVGYLRHGILGSCLSWFAFTLPSAVVLTVFALIYDDIPGINNATWLHGLKVVAVAVVAQALVGMQKQLCPDLFRRFLALTAAVLLLLGPALVPGVVMQLGVILAGALAGFILIDHSKIPGPGSSPLPSGQSVAPIALALFVMLLIMLPVAAAGTTLDWVHLADGFYRAGSLVFGGGHVVLPMLQSEVVPTGWVEQGEFVAGYGAAQAVPGPLFTFAAYLGAASTLASGDIQSILFALLAVVAIFLPGYLLVIGLLPVWHRFRDVEGVRSALEGVNAVVVGLLLAAFLDPVIPAAIFSLADAGLALAAFVLLVHFRVPAWAVVIVCAVTTALLW